MDSEKPKQLIYITKIIITKDIYKLKWDAQSFTLFLAEGDPVNEFVGLTSQIRYL